MQSKEKCNKKDNKESKIKVKRPIGRKLSSIFASLIVFFLGITVVLIYILFANDQRVNAKANVVSINETTSGQVESKFHNVQGNTNNFLNILYFICMIIHFLKKIMFLFFR